ncbi:hypothetical protein OIU84_000349 [Salix udensis]|uniref:Lon N-terminal domain-containing protein n=1 Tax=Salix udensis TaxID=889485 RepID=A0AAD6L5N6_9ROSI|nr:hypothetical protein OIU84_000349 [Salix udensis]
MEEDNRILEAERHQIEQIRQLDFEELQVEEVDDDDDDDSLDDRDGFGAGTSDDFTFNTCLASLHTYLGEVEDTHHRLAFLDGGAILNLPLFYLEGVVLFPEATLPLRVIQPNFISAVERALVQVDAPYTVGVVRAYRDSDNRRLRFANVGTTAEIRQYRRLEDGSLNIVTRGQQRFRLKRRWIDVEGVPCGEVQIIQEDMPLRTPKDAFGKLAPLRNLRGHKFSAVPPATSSSVGYGHSDNDSEGNSEESFETALSLAERRIHQSALNSCYGYDMMDESMSSDDDKFMSQLEEMRSRRSHLSETEGSLYSDTGKNVDNTTLEIGNTSGLAKKGEGSKRCWKKIDLNQFRRVPRAFWPHWVYSMHDSYCLAERATDMWKQIVGVPSMDGLVRKPDLLSFYIASKIPVSEEIRQELLEIDGISYRLRREIDLLETVDLVQCKTCKVINGIESSKFLLRACMCICAHTSCIACSAYVHMMTPAFLFP